MKRWIVFLLILLILFTVYGCSRNQIGDLFRDFGDGDPGDDGFGPGGPGGGNGGFTVLSLEPGTLFVDGTPDLLAVHPEDSSLDVDVNTLIVLRFSESLDPDESKLETGIVVRRVSDGTKISGDYSTAPGSSGTVVVIEPSDPLADNEEYQISVNSKIVDAQGFGYDPGEGVPATVFGFFTGKAGDAVPFEIISILTVPTDGAAGVSDGAPVLVFFTEAVDTSNSNTGLGGTSDNLKVKVKGGSAVQGDRSFEYGDRLLVFTPTSAYPGGKEITVKIESQVENSDGSEHLDQAYNTAFTVLSFPRVTKITFPQNNPLIALPGSLYAGRVNSANQHAIKVKVTLEGAGDAVRLTIVFWDNSTNAVIAAKEGQLVAGTFSFTVDLKPGEGHAILDGTTTVGAYTRSGGVNSPVGPPLVLPDLRKDVIAPKLDSLGPPNLVPFPPLPPFYDLLVEAADPGVHGRASESLSKVQVEAEFLGTSLPAVSAIKFFSMEYPEGSGIYSEEVTRGGKNLFITKPLVDFSTGMSKFSNMLGRAQPVITVTKITLTDLVGNKTVLKSGIGASLDFRGYFYKILNGSGSDFEVNCYNDATLQPLQNVDIIVEDIDLGVRWATFTDVNGDAAITTIEGTPVLGDRMMVTAVKDGFQILSLVWTYTLNDLWTNLPLTLETESLLEFPLGVVIGNTTGVDLPDVYVGGTELRTGNDDTLVKSATANPLSITVNVKKNRLQFIETIGVETTPSERYQWAWSNPFVRDSDVGVEVVFFSETLIVPDPVQPVTFDPFGDPGNRQARLMAGLPGITGTLPLGVDLVASDEGGLNRFDIPLPPSLFINEVIGVPLESSAFDPPYEVMIQPDLGDARNDDLTPDEALLQDHLFFEMERIDEVADPRIVRSRFDYDPAKLGIVEAVTLENYMADPPDLNLPDLQWENVLAPFFTGDPDIGLYRSTLENTITASPRHWVTYMGFGAAGTLADVTFVVPDLETVYGALPDLSGTNAYDDFSAAGAYPFFVEAYYIPTLGLSSTFFSLIEKGWKSYWRSAKIDITKP